MNPVVAVETTDPSALPAGTRLLNGQYEILDRLQQGGFGITYIARDSLERQVVIKECFPAGLCLRAGTRVRPVSARAEAQVDRLKRQFMREARIMAMLDHPHIVAVHQVFEENDSAYMALDLVPGLDLLALLDNQPRRLTPGFLESVLRQSLDALRHIHAHGILHRDIAPDNICVDEAGAVMLIDFGAASRPATGPEAGGPVLAVKDGYSPWEFYLDGDYQDPSSDLYSLGASFYHLITGQAPPNGRDRAAALRSGRADPFVPLCAGDWAPRHDLLSSIDRALQVDRSARFPSAEAWIASLDATPRRRPAAPRIPEFDAQWEAGVKRLVRETNEILAPHLAARRPETDQEPDAPQEPDRAGGPDARRPEPAQARPADAGSARRQWFDIIGNPIADLEAWKAEQERELQARARRLARQTSAAEGAETAADAPRPRPPGSAARTFPPILNWRGLFRGAASSAG